MADTCAMWVADPEGGHFFTWKQNPAKPLAWSLVFVCTNCGETYSKLTAFVGETKQPFHAVSGYCNFCLTTGTDLPGSLETLRFVGWDKVPKEVVHYQLTRELDYFDRKHKQGRYQCSNSSHLLPFPE